MMNETIRQSELLAESIKIALEMNEDLNNSFVEVGTKKIRDLQEKRIREDKKRPEETEPTIEEKIIISNISTLKGFLEYRKIAIENHKIIIELFESGDIPENYTFKI